MTDQVNGTHAPGLSRPLPDQPVGVLMMLNTPDGNILTFHTDGAVTTGPAFTTHEAASLKFLETLTLTYLGWLPQVVAGWLRLQRGSPVTRAHLRGVLPGLHPEVCDRVVAGLCEELAAGVLEESARVAVERERQAVAARAAQERAAAAEQPPDEPSQLGGNVGVIN